MRVAVSLPGFLIRLAGLLGASWLIVACSTSASPSSPVAPAATSTPIPLPGSIGLDVEIARSIAYANVGEVETKLDVYAPSEPGPWPVVIVAPGVNQSRSAVEDLSKTIASEGAVVYNIDVRFTVPFITGIQRIACAVRFARATAANYDGDPSWLTLVGNSDGAATAMVVALAGEDFEGDCAVTDASALPEAVVAFEGRYDYPTTADTTGSFDHTFLQDEDPELWHAINPYSHIGLNPDLHVRLVHGDDADAYWYDVPLEVSIEFHQTLVDAGYDVELIVLDGASHTALTGAYLFPDAFAMMVQQVMEATRNPSR